MGKSHTNVFSFFPAYEDKNIFQASVVVELLCLLPAVIGDSNLDVPYHVLFLQSQIKWIPLQILSELFGPKQQIKMIHPLIKHVWQSVNLFFLWRQILSPLCFSSHLCVTCDRLCASFVSFPSCVFSLILQEHIWPLERIWLCSAIAFRSHGTSAAMKVISAPFEMQVTLTSLAV